MTSKLSIYDSPLLRNKDALDFMATLVLKKLSKSKYFTYRKTPWLRPYHKFKEEIGLNFIVPETSISPLMSRILFGISFQFKPKIIVAIGTYVGYSLAWIAGPVISAKRLNKNIIIYNVDKDKKSLELARLNFKNINKDIFINFKCMDGHDIFKHVQETIDLLYIDVDDPIHRKKIYKSILNIGYDKLKSGSIILAHDITFPKFISDLSDYKEFVKNKDLFVKTSTLAIDEYGLEVSIKL